MTVETVAWRWHYDSVGYAVVNRPAFTSTDTAPPWLANMMPRGPEPLVLRSDYEAAEARAQRAEQALMELVESKDALDAAFGHERYWEAELRRYNAALAAVRAIVEGK